MNSGPPLRVVGLLLPFLLPVACRREEPPPAPASEEPARAQRAPSAAQPPTRSPPPATPEARRVQPAKRAATDARYDQPVTSGPGPSDPVGHTVVMVGFDRSERDRHLLHFVDPADNLVDGIGMHLWDDSASTRPLSLDEGALTFELSGRRAVIVGAVCARPTAAALPDPPPAYRQSGVPDLSQHAGSRWTTYCCPTTAADIIYFLSRRHAALRQGRPPGPGAPADEGATALIAGADAPPPGIGSLAALMATSASNGTSAGALRDGLALYLETHDADPLIRWQIVYVASRGDDQALVGFWDRLCGFVAADAGVILTLLFHSTGQDAVSGSDLASSQDSVAGAAAQVDQASPHAATGGAASAAEGAANGVARGGTAHDGVDPGTMRFEPSAPIEGILPALPDSTPLPDLDRLLEPGPDAAPPGRRQHPIVGRWRQIDGNRKADFAEGGYRDCELWFRSNGMLTIRRTFDRNGSMVLVRELVYDVSLDGTLTLGRKAGRASSPARPATIRIPLRGADTVAITPPATATPTRLEVEIVLGRLQLGTKAYARIP